MENYLTTLSQWIAKSTIDDIPDSVIEHSKLVLADTIGAIAGGSAELEINKLSKTLSDDGKVPIIGTSFKSTMENAAFLNGTAGTFLEMDEGNQYARGHPAIHVVPAILAWANAKPDTIDIKLFLKALIIGYEVGARVGMASKIRLKMHPHGTWGTIGAAVAIGVLNKASPEQIKNLINISSTLGLGTSRPTMLQGGTVRNVYSGVSNQMGILAWQLCQSGFTGEADGLSTIYGSVVSTEFNPKKMIEKLGERWEIARNYFKIHACCRYNHASLDCVETLLNQNAQEFDLIDKIEKIEVKSYFWAAELDDKEPKNVLAGKFSIPFAVASTIYHKNSKTSSFTIDKVKNSKIIDLAKKVEVEEDLEMTKLLPEKRPASVSVFFNDGKVLSHSTLTNRGDAEDPYNEEDIEQKFYEITERVWEKTKAEKIFKGTLDLSSTSDLKNLMHSLAV